ncbi:MAG: phosphatase PAP2 family protein [Ignavibacteria bacterium]|nr:phosphatase PAP2 family protein [Ignavibacteria bacterium]
MKDTYWVKRWKEFLSHRRLSIEFTVTVILLVLTVYFFSRYLLFNETRAGAVIDDPLQRHFTAVDLNVPIFFAIYSSLLIGLISFSFNPKQLMMAFQTYIVLVVLRMISMYLIPLDPPAECIDLQDPVVFMMGTGQKIVKDLFFSGHTSTSFMLFQVARNKYLKAYFLAATITVGISVVLQKAHYTIDVVAGLVYSYASYQLVKHWHAKYHHLEIDKQR